MMEKTTEYKTSPEDDKKDPTKYTTDQSGHFRPDLLFSYWIFVYFLFYYFINKSSSLSSKWVSEHMNPIYLLYVALLENIFTFLFILLVKPNYLIIIQYLFMMFLVKILPIYLLWNIPIKHKMENIGICILCFGIYLFYLFLNNTDIIKIYKRTFTSIIQNQSDTPLFYLIHHIFGTTV